MSDVLATLFNDFDRGRLTRRQLLQALGIAAAARPVSALAFGQDTSGGRAGTPQRDTTPAPLPFEPTGWKTVLLDHFSMQVADYQKEAAYFAALMNWKVRSDDGMKAVLDIGDWGSLVLRGGYQPPPPPPTPPPPPPPPAGDAAAAAGAAGAAGAGRGGGRGGGRGPSIPRLSVVDGFCWGIEPWDAKKVESELKKRGLTPVADNDGKDFQSFHVKDPDGFDLQISNGNTKNRRKGAANGKLSMPAPWDATNWKTVWLDHISFQCTKYKESVAFYQALLGWKPGADTGNQNQCEIGDVGGVIIRSGGGGRGGAAATPPTPPPPRHATIDHIAFGITPWDVDVVRAELEKRNLSVSADSGSTKGPNPADAEKAMEATLGHPLTNLDRQVADMHGAGYQSYHTTTPNGYNLQISFVTKATRNAGSTPGGGLF
jgi:catechol 2,3-dioxygenase-like lactoylglutathione lyase family enzyme